LKKLAGEVEKLSGVWRHVRMVAEQTNQSLLIQDLRTKVSDERQGHSTIFASTLVCFCIEAGTSSPLTRFVRAWCILVYSRPASLLGNYRVCKCYCKRLRFTGDANVRYFSNGDLLVERSTFGGSLISKLACITNMFRSCGACSGQSEGI